MANLRLSGPVLPQKSWWVPVSRSPWSWRRQACVCTGLLIERNLKVKKASKSVWIIPYKWTEDWDINMSILIDPSIPRTMKWALIFVPRQVFGEFPNFILILRCRSLSQYRFSKLRTKIPYFNSLNKFLGQKSRLIFTTISEWDLFIQLFVGVRKEYVLS